MPTLEVQAMQIRGDISRQAQTARAQVQAEASRALKREPRVVEVGHTVAPIGVTQASIREVEEWKKQQYSAIAKAEREAQEQLNRAVTEAVEAQKLTKPTYEGITPEEQALLDQGYSVDEINRRRELAAQKEYEVALAEQEKEFLKDNVLVAGNQYVPKEEYNKLSSEDKKLIQQVGINQFNTLKDREYQAALAEETAFRASHVEVTPDQWVEKSEWDKLTPSQQSEVKLTGQYTAEAPGQSIVELTTASGKKIEIPQAEWEAKNEFEKLTQYLERAPTYSEMQSLARPEMPSYGGIFNLPLIGGLLSNVRLGTELLLSGTQSPVEAYWRETLPEAARLKKQYEEIMYPIVPVVEPTVVQKILYGASQGLPILKLIPGVPKSKEELKFWRGVGSALESEWGLGALTRPASPQITIREITGGEWKQAGISLALLYGTPLAIKGVSAGIGAIRGATVRIPGPIVKFQKPIVLGVGRQLPITFEKLKVGTLASGKYIWIPKPVIRSPLTRLTTGIGLFEKPAGLLSVRTPIRIGWGSGLERAGLTKLVSNQALAAGSAAKELISATRSLSKLEMTSPNYLKLQSRLTLAQNAANLADTRLMQSLGGVKLTSTQLNLLERATGLRGLKTSVTNLATSIKLANKAWSNVETYKPGTSGYLKALNKYDIARTNVATATSKLESILSPRYKAPPHAGWGKVISTAEREVLRAKTAIERAEAGLREFGLQKYREALEVARSGYKNALGELENYKVAMQAGELPPTLTGYKMSFKPDEGLLGGGFGKGGTMPPSIYAEMYSKMSASWREPSPWDMPEGIRMPKPNLQPSGRAAVAEPLVGQQLGLFAETVPLESLAPQFALELTPTFGRMPYASPLVDLPRLMPSMALTPMGIAVLSLTPTMVGGLSGLMVPGEVYPEIELIPGYGEVTTKTGKSLQRGVSPLVISQTTPGWLTRQATWLSPAQLQAIWLSPSQMILPTYELENLVELRNLTSTQWEVVPAQQTKLAEQMQLQTKTLTKTLTKLATSTKIATKLQTKIIPKFLLVPLPTDEKKKKKKKLWYEAGTLLEPYPGMYPGLILHFPEPLAPVEDMTRPRQVIKKTRITLRKRGTYAVAGFREVR